MDDLITLISMAGAGALLYGIPAGFLYFALTWLEYRKHKRTNEIEAANWLRKRSKVVIWGTGLCAAVLLFMAIVGVSKPAPDFGGNAALVAILGLGFVLLLALSAFFTGLILLPSRIPPSAIGRRRNPHLQSAPHHSGEAGFTPNDSKEIQGPSPPTPPEFASNSPTNRVDVARSRVLDRVGAAPKFDFFDQPRSRQALRVAFGVFIYFLIGLFFVIGYTAYVRDEMKLKLSSGHPSDCLQRDLDAVKGACREKAPDARCYERFRMNLRCVRLRDALADLQVLCGRTAVCEHRSHYEEFKAAMNECEARNLPECRRVLKMQREAGAKFSVDSVNPFLCDRGDPDSCYILSSQYQTGSSHKVLARSCHLGSEKACSEFTCERLYIFLKWPVIVLRHPERGGLMLKFPSWPRQCGTT